MDMLGVEPEEEEDEDEEEEDEEEDTMDPQLLGAAGGPRSSSEPVEAVRLAPSVHSQVVPAGSASYRVIVHVDLDCFYAQVEMISHPELKGKPLGVQQKYLVVTCNYEARKLGVKKLMSVRDAKEKCPQLVLVNGEDLTRYREMSYKVTELLEEFSPVVERLGFDENFVDITQTVEKRLHQLQSDDYSVVAVCGHVYNNQSVNLNDILHVRLLIGSQIAAEMREAIFNQLGLTGCAGVASNKLLSKLVSGTFKPNQQTVLMPESCQDLIGSLDHIKQMPGIGYKTTKRLESLGINSVHDLQIFSPEILEKELGISVAQRIQKLSFGEDNSPVTPSGPPQSFSEEDSFKKCSSEVEAKKKIEELLAKLLNRVCKDGRKPHTIRLIIRRFSSDRHFNRESRQCPIPSHVIQKLGTGFQDFDFKRSKSLSCRNQMINDIDSISLTTDDLVHFPPDGSLPTDTYIGSLHQNSKQNRKFLKKTSSENERNTRFLDPCNSVENEDLFTPVLFSDTNEKHCGVITSNKHCKYISALSAHSSEMPSLTEKSKHHIRKNYPRWLTSQKSDLNVSGITSIPNYNYPLWLHDQDLLPDSSCQSSPQMQRKEQHIYMEKKKTQFAHKLDYYEHCSSISDSTSDKVLVNCQQNCELGQFQYENIPFSGQSKKPFSDDKIELLILKAKRSLEHSPEGLSSTMKNDVNPCSLDKLETERSWENIPVTFKSPVPVDCGERPQQIVKVKRVNEFLEDCLNAENPRENFYSDDSFSCISKMLCPEDESSIKEDVIPITRSLQKALHHLSRLRELVEDTRGKSNLI
ncbi:DNA polymerase iota isoform 3-T3 [Sarcophilus harrisii]